MLDHIEAVLDQLAIDINAAWNLNSDRIVFEEPDKPVQGVPYAVILLGEEIPREADVRVVRETYTFQIVGTFKVEDDLPKLIQGIQKIQALGNQLVPSWTTTPTTPDGYAGVASAWFIPKVDCGDFGEKDDRLYRVSLFFECTVIINE